LQCTCRTGTTFCGAGSANLNDAINSLGGDLAIECGAVDSASNTATCNFKQATLQGLFGTNGLALNGCIFGECVRQNAIDEAGGATSTTSQASKTLSGGVIAGLAVVCGLVLLFLLLLALGLRTQRRARKCGAEVERSKVAIEWSDLSYVIPGTGKGFALASLRNRKAARPNVNTDKVILDSVSGKVEPGQMMAVLGPSGKLLTFVIFRALIFGVGAGKTTLVELLAGKNKSGAVSGRIDLISDSSDSKRPPRIGFVAQQDILPPTLTVFETLLFAARLRLPESVTDQEKQERVNNLLQKLGISNISNTRVGDVTGGKARGISGGEMRRLSIGLELIASPDLLLLDEPTSGLDSVSAARVADVLHAIVHDPAHPTPIIASIHQPRLVMHSCSRLNHGLTKTF